MSNENNNSPNHDDLSQDATDKRTADPQQMTNQEINIRVAYQPDHREDEISMLYYAFVIILYCFVIYLCWPLIIFGFLAYQLIVYDGQTDAAAREPQSCPCCSPENYRHGWMRDAQVEGRTAQPTDNPIQFSPTTQMPPPETLGIQNTQEHDPAVLPVLNNVQHAGAIATDENREIIAANAPNGANISSVIDYLTIVVFMSRLARIMNTVPAIESQDDVHSSDSSEEDEQIVSTESGNDGDDENDSVDDTERRGQTSPIPQYQLNLTQNHVQSTQTNTVNDQTTDTTDSNPLHSEAVDIEVNVTTLTDVTHHAIIRRVRSTFVPLPKTRNLLQLHEESSDEDVE